MVALDAKVSFDDNALYRHPELEKLRDEAEEDPKELEAAKYSLNYVALDGTIGCMVNGAGLAMATMDIIKLYGGSPANFLDVGGGATKERVTAAFKIILSDPNVEGILVNIFGGIMRCDVIAEGVVAAAREVSLGVPLVVRLEGTNVELGKEIMAKSGLPIICGRQSGRRRREGGPGREGGRIMADSGRHEHAGHHPGLHRRAGHVPFRAGDRLRHQGHGRGDAGQGRHASTWTCRCSTRWPRRCTRRGANATAIYVPPPFAADAILEAIDAEIPLIICITEGIPVLDMVRVKRALAGSKSRLIGPNCPGVITPEACKIGIMPGHIHRRGTVGIVSRSRHADLRGGGADHGGGAGPEHLRRHRRRPGEGDGLHRGAGDVPGRPGDESIIMIGEIGGKREIEAAEFIAKSTVKKPVVGFIAGATAPPGRRMGHAGAVICGGRDTAAAKFEAMRAAGIHVADSPAALGSTMVRALGA